MFVMSVCMLTVSDRDSCCFVCMLTVSDRDSCCVCNVCLYVDSVGQRQLLCLGRSLCVDSVGCTTNHSVF